MLLIWTSSEWCSNKQNKFWGRRVRVFIIVMGVYDCCWLSWGRKERIACCPVQEKGSVGAAVGWVHLSAVVCSPTLRWQKSLLDLGEIVLCFSFSLYLFWSRSLLFVKCAKRIEDVRISTVEIYAGSNNAFSWIYWKLCQTVYFLFDL